MKRLSDTLFERFVDVVRNVKGWMNIDGFATLCDQHGVFDDDAQAAMVAQYKKAEIRKMLRRMGREPAAGELSEQLEWVNLIVRTPEGNRQQVYKQLRLFDEGDFVQVIRERMNRVQYWRAEVDRLVLLAVARFGPRIKDLLLFDDDEPEMREAIP